MCQSWLALRDPACSDGVRELIPYLIGKSPSTTMSQRYFERGLSVERPPSDYVPDRCPERAGLGADDRAPGHLDFLQLVLVPMTR